MAGGGKGKMFNTESKIGTDWVTKAAGNEHIPRLNARTEDMIPGTITSPCFAL